MDKKILITGGAGFIGRHLTKMLLDLSYDVIIYDNLNPQIHGEDASYEYVGAEKFVKADIRSKEQLQTHLEGVNIVYHLASETGTGQSMYEMERYVDVNDRGTAILLEAISNSSSVTDIVLSSSRSIYGEGLYSDGDDLVNPSSRKVEDLKKGVWEIRGNSDAFACPRPTSEDCPINPGSIYAATKYSQENFLNIFAGYTGIRTSILRFQNVYGPGQSLRNPYTGIISIFYNRIRQNLPINIFEDGLESRDFVYVGDVVDSLIKAITRTVLDNVVLNIGTGVPTTVIDLVETFSEVLNTNVVYDITGDFRLGDIRHNYADISLASSMIGYSPKYQLKSGLIEFVTWAASQPEYEDFSGKALSELKSKGLSN
jgi:dTDP-L-rhamnose 4-epimerase